MTTWVHGWSGLMNGALLNAADRELSYQQNLKGRKMAMVVLSTNNWSSIRAHVGGIVAAIGAAAPGSYAEVEIPFG